MSQSVMEPVEWTRGIIERAGILKNLPKSVGFASCSFSYVFNIKHSTIEYVPSRPEAQSKASSLILFQMLQLLIKFIKPHILSHLGTEKRILN